jgi:hypothetical protein
MAITFPSNPTNGQLYTVAGKSWLWDGISWNATPYNSSFLSHSATHGVGGTDAVTIAESQVTNLVSDLAAKAPLASPTFTGTPAAPTATAGTNTTQVATTAFVSTAIAGFSALPSQSGKAGLYLSTDGTTASWQAAGGASKSTIFFLGGM